MRTTIASVIVFVLLGLPPASAQKVDMSTITCDAFIKAGQEFHGQALMWLTGYYSEEDADAIIDFDKIVSNGQKLGRMCAENPTMGLMTAAEKIMN